MTFYATANEGPISALTQPVTALNWVPVINCKDQDECLHMVCSRFLRERGGVLAGTVVRFSVLLRGSMDMKTPEGRIVKSFEMEARKP